ncbi:MAG: ribonuclease Z [Desulfuromonas sp.]|nr:MAG: ribonuclease Z [Desulfuromonas sp.]
MRPVFYPLLVDGPHGDPAFYVRIAHRREALLFDCGSLASLTAREMSKVRHLFISHTHVDHFIDFDRLVRFFLYTDHHLTVHGPSGLARQVGSRLAGYTWNLVDGFPFEITVREWDGAVIDSFRFRARNAFRMEELDSIDCPDGRLLETAAYHVSAVRLDHGNITSLAYTLQEVLHIAIHKDALERAGYRPGPWLTDFKDFLRSQQACPDSIEVPLHAGGSVTCTIVDLAARIAHTEPGMKICYVTDVSPTEANLEKIIALAASAHLLAIEAPFAHSDLERARKRNHLTAHLAGAIAAKAQVSRCLFFHFSPRYHETGYDLAKEGEAAFRTSAQVR